MQIETIEAVEVFRGVSEMPPEFSAPDIRCGAVAIWTRRGLSAPRSEVSGRGSLQGKVVQG